MVQTKTSMSLTGADSASVIAIDYQYESGMNVEIVVRGSLVKIYEDSEKVGECFFSDLPNMVR